MTTLPPDFAQYLEFQGATWKTLKLWLEKKREIKIGMLVGAPTHDESNRIRGALSMLEEILALEKAANPAAYKG